MKSSPSFFKRRVAFSYRTGQLKELPMQLTDIGPLLLAIINFKRTVHQGMTLENGRTVCTYCKRLGHLKDKCYQLHERPPHIAKAHMIQHPQQGGTSSETAEALQGMMKELQKLTTIINSSSSSIVGSTSMANSGIKTIISSFHMNSQITPGILDSGATDHMTLTYMFFKSYEPIAPGKHVQTADETLLPVAGIGTMHIQPIGLLTHVLHVPNLFVNLISVQRLAKLTEYRIVFDDLDAYLCHKVQRSRIGLARI